MQKFIILLLALVPAAYAQEFATSFKTTEVATGIYMIEGVGGFGGGNMGLLVGKDYVAMIDDGLEPLAPTLLQHVAETTAGRPVNFMVNTHVHGDHAGGNARFAENGTIVFAHDNIRRRLVQDPSPAGGTGGIPVVTFAEGVTFHLNGIEARVFHLPKAHTDGDAVIYFPGANVIHTGDIMFNGLFPYIDLGNGGSVDGYINAQQKILALANDDTALIPGHGPVASKSDLRDNLDVLIDSQKRIRALVDSGDSEDEIVAANPLSIYHDDYDWGFITTERMTRTLIRSLTTD